MADGKHDTLHRVLFRVGLGTAVLGVLSFLHAMVLWGISLLGDLKQRDLAPAYWGWYWSAVPAVILFTVFLCAILLRRRRWLFWSLLLIGLAVSAAWSTYDAVHRNYQFAGMMAGRGGFHSYFNWPWMNKLDEDVLKLLGGPAK